MELNSLIGRRIVKHFAKTHPSDDVAKIKVIPGKPPQYQVYLLDKITQNRNIKTIRYSDLI